MTTTNRLPTDLPALLTGANAAIVNPGGGGESSGDGVIPSGGAYYDWLIGGVPFLAWPEQDDPYIRDTQEDVKEQFDSSREAGEQSFGYWWLRSQATFHGGGGQSFLDTGQADVNRTRYLTSNFVDVFDQGQVTVLDDFNRSAGDRSDICLTTWSNVPRLVVGSSVTNVVTVYTLPDLTGASPITVGTSGAVQAVASDGENVYVAISDKVYKIPASGTPTLVANISFVGPVVMGVAKQRVILCTGPKVYEVDPTGGTLSPTAKYTNPSPNWRYTSVADGPNGIYLAGFLGPNSELASMTVADSGSGLTLGNPVVQLRTPPGEIINECVFYLNAFFGLATSNGVRVGTFTPYGQPTYGPLLNPGEPCYSVTGSGSLLYFGGENTIWAVDLGTQIEQGRYAYSRVGSGFNAAGTDPITSIVCSVATGSDKLHGLQSSGALLSQPATGVVPDAGTLVTSWARFGTVEPKRLHYVRVEGTFPGTGSDTAMTIQIESIDGASTTFIVPGGKTFYEFGVGAVAPSEAFRLTFTLKPGTILRSWQLKTRPAPPQFQQLIIPLGCWDYETGADGQETGYQGYAMDRLLQLEGAATANRVITVQDRWANTQYQAQITRCQYRQTVLPGRTGRDGGKITLVLRLV